MRLAEAHRQEGLLEDALRILRDGLTRQPDSISARLALARTLLEQASFDEALAEADRIDKMAPGTLEVLEIKAQILLLRRGSPGAPGLEMSDAAEMPSGPPAGLASPTLMALYRAQGYAERAESPTARGAADSPAADEPATDLSLLRRLTAFRDAARRRREGLRQ